MLDRGPDAMTAELADHEARIPRLEELVIAVGLGAKVGARCAVVVGSDARIFSNPARSPSEVGAATVIGPTGADLISEIHRGGGGG